MEHPKVSLNTIAKEFNVSKVTISKALNDKEGVSEDLRKIIKARAEELGYHIPVMAKALKSNRTYNIGIIVPEWFMQQTNTYYFQVYTLFVKKLSELGYNGMMEVLEKKDEKECVLPKLYLEKKVDGIIVLGECAKNYLKLYTQVTVPVIFFDFYNSDINIDAITVDNFYAGQMITKHLIDKGFKKIGFIGNIHSTSSIKDRFLGYYRALLDARLDIDYKYVLSDRDENGFLNKIEFPAELPGAYVCNSDQIAFDVIKEFNKMGINVPEDVSIVAFDNSVFSEISSPKITTIDANANQMVEVAVKAIIKKINIPYKVYDRILVKGNIVNRESVK